MHSNLSGLCQVLPGPSSGPGILVSWIVQKSLGEGAQFFSDLLDASGRIGDCLSRIDALDNRLGHQVGQDRLRR